MSLFERVLAGPRQSGLGDEPVALMRRVGVCDVEEAKAAMEARDVPPDSLMVEPKFNGWLTQVVNGRFWSRRGKELTRKFPEIESQIKGFKRDHLLGELVYWGPNGYMEEPAVTHVAGTKDPASAVRKLREVEREGGQFQLVLFDVIAVNGRDISQQSTAERADMLDKMVRQETQDVAFSPIYDLSSWKTVYEDNLCLGGDGVVLKNPEAPYLWRPLGEHEARPHGYWYKLKPSSTDDFVVRGTHRGPKGKLLLELAQYHKGKLVFVSDMNNLSMKKEEEVLRRLKRGALVVEVEFQSRFPDPPGALQHPRFVRFRDDKNPRDVTLPGEYVIG